MVSVVGGGRNVGKPNNDILQGFWSPQGKYKIWNSNRIWQLFLAPLVKCRPRVGKHTHQICLFTYICIQNTQMYKKKKSVDLLSMKTLRKIFFFCPMMFKATSHRSQNKWWLIHQQSKTKLKRFASETIDAAMQQSWKKSPSDVWMWRRSPSSAACLPLDCVSTLPRCFATHVRNS